MISKGDNSIIPIAYSELVETDVLQKMQDFFCKVARVFVFGVGENGKRITEMSGDKKEREKLMVILDEPQIISILKQVLNNSIEEQVIEDTEYCNVKIAGISSKLGGHPYISWFVCGILSDIDEPNETKVEGFQTTLTTVDFYSSLDLLRFTTQNLFKNIFKASHAIIESAKNRTTAIEISRDLQRSESMAEIVQLLDCDDGFEDIVDKILKISGKFIAVSCCHIIREGKQNTAFEFIGQWDNGQLSQEHFNSYIQNMNRILGLSDKVLIISSDTAGTKDILEKLRKCHVRAMIAMPIYINHKVAMYTCFLECDNDRTWHMEEIKFISDVTKVVQSILTRRIQKNSLTSSYTSLGTILDNVGGGIYVRDIENNEVLFANRILKNTFEQELKDGSINELFDERTKGVQANYLEIYYPVKQCWYDLHYTHISWVDGRRVLLCAVYDITDKKVYQQKIEQQANNDFLTGLFNRMCCERDLVRYVDEAKIKGTTGALLYLDLDDFKHINDGLGHQYGDVLLKAISHSIQRIDGIQDTCYRMGGDEFVIIISESSYEHFDEILEAIKILFNKPWFLKGRDYYCTTSMGIVIFPEDGENVQDLIKKADIAMYEAKKSGKNRTAYYTEEAEVNSYRRIDMEKNMREAMSQDYGEFEVYYQPIINPQKEDMPCLGAEALIRWNSDEMGLVSPSEFIPLAEYLGLINPIGNHVLKQACIACKEWNTSGHPYCKINVNLSVVQLLQTDIIEVIADVLRETGINPKNLTLEVTESLAINDIERMKEILGNIRAFGVGIALDDFGTGYSSLNHIREIPLDVIKVDQSFSAGLTEDTYAKAFIKMVAELAATIGVKVCVEGVETLGQLKVLKDLKVSYIQGFYFDRPMKKEEFEHKYITNIPKEGRNESID